MKIIKEWVHEGLGEIVCAKRGEKRLYYFGRKEKIKFLSKEPKLYSVMFSFFATSDEELEDIFYNRTLEQKEEYEKHTLTYKSFLNSIENIEKDLLKYCQEELQEDYFQYYGYHFVDEDLPVWNETKDLYDYFEVIEIDIFPTFYQIILKTKLGYQDMELTGPSKYAPLHLSGIGMATTETKPISTWEDWKL